MKPLSSSVVCCLLLLPLSSLATHGSGNSLYINHGQEGLDDPNCQTLTFTNELNNLHDPSNQPDSEQLDHSLTSAHILLGPSGPSKHALLELIANGGHDLTVYRTIDGELVASKQVPDRTARSVWDPRSSTYLKALPFGANYSIYDMPEIIGADGSQLEPILRHKLASKLFQHLRSATLVFVLPYEDILDPEWKRLNALANEAIHMISNMDQVEPAMALIVTNVPQRNPATGSRFKSSEIHRSIASSLRSFQREREQMSKASSSFMRPEDKEIASKKAAWVSIFLKSGRIAFLRHPRQCGPLMNDLQMVRSQKRIREMLGQLRFVPISDRTFNIPHQTAFTTFDNSESRGTLGAAGDDCQWSYCAGSLISGQATCDEYGLRYSGRYTGANCGFGTAQVECCSYAGRATDPGYIIRKSGCEWSYCAGITIAGQTTCNEYGKTYTGRVQKSDCSFTTEQVECCKFEKVLSKDCKRTHTCWGMNYGANYACQSDYGSEYQAVIENDGGKSSQGCGSYTWTYKCCK